VSDCPAKQVQTTRAPSLLSTLAEAISFKQFKPALHADISNKSLIVRPLESPEQTTQHADQVSTATPGIPHRNQQLTTAL
jgi:hypothetical protein